MSHTFPTTRVGVLILKDIDLGPAMAVRRALSIISGGSVRVEVKSNSLLKCTEEEQVIEEIHVSTENIFFATSFRVDIVDIAQIVSLIPTHRFSLRNEPCSKGLAELFDKLAKLFRLVAVLEQGIADHP